jgi:hypothetical protein
MSAVPQGPSSMNVNLVRNSVRARRGAALLIVVLALVVLAALAGTLTGVSLSSQQQGVSATQLSRALYVAEAGVSECIAAVHTGALATSGKLPSQLAFGDADAPLEFAGGSYFALASYEPLDRVTITSFGTVGGRTRGIEAVMTRNLSLIYRSAVFAGNSDGDPAYVMPFSGEGSQADEIHGDIYSGGSIAFSGDASIDGTPRAEGAVTGVEGQTGISQTPPDLAGMEYAVNNDVDVAALFASGATYVLDDLGGTAWQMPESSPAHIFRKDPSDRILDIAGTTKADYFLEDPYEAVEGSATVAPAFGSRISLSGLNGEPGPNGSDLVYFIDGNLWVHNRNVFNFTLYTAAGAPARVTFVVQGNIYVSDNILLQNPDQDGLALISMKDPAVEDSGNIYFGDPRFGTLERMDAFMFAENDFVDNNLSATGSARVTVNGNMTAGDQVRIHRDFGTQHSKLTVEFDDRLVTGELVLPGLPGTNPGNEVWALATWREIAIP